MAAEVGENAIDIALKTARHATQKRKIVSIVKAYHGHTGLAVGTGDDRFSKLFLSDQPEDFPHVPFNDLEAMEDALRGLHWYLDPANRTQAIEIISKFSRIIDW